MTHTKDEFLTYMEDLEMQGRAEDQSDGREKTQQMEQELAQLHLLVPPIDLGLMQPSIATSEQIANGLIAAIVEGRISPLEFVVKKKCVMDAFELAFKNEEVKNLAIAEVERCGKEGASLYGATIKITSTSKYEYEKDPRWKQINDSLADGLAARKEQEEKIKQACKLNGSIVDQETGEVIAQQVPNPRTDTIAVSFKTKK